MVPEKILDLAPDLISDAPELLSNLLVSALGGGGIFEGPVKSFYLPREYRAHFLAAESDHRLDPIRGDLVDGFRSVGGNIDAQFQHHFSGKWIEMGGRRAGAIDLTTLGCHRPSQSFRHLAARGIGHTKKENTR